MATASAVPMTHVSGGQAAAPARGYADLPCPRCGATDGLHVRLVDGDLGCSECSADDIGAEELRAIAARYLALAGWIEAMPADPAAGRE